MRGSGENFARHATPIYPYRLQQPNNNRRTRKWITKGDTENEGEISRGSPSLLEDSRRTSCPCIVEEGRIGRSGLTRACTEPEPRESAPAAITTGSTPRRHLLRSSSPDHGVYHPKPEPVQKSPLRERAPRRRKCGNAAARQCLGLGELLGGAQAESTEFVSTGAGNLKASVPRIKVAGL